MRTMDSMDLIDLEDLCSLPIWDWPEDASKRLDHALKNGQSHERILAAELAAHILDDQLAAALLEVTSGDDDPEVRSAAATSLGPELENCHDMQLSGEVGDISPELYTRILQRLRHLYHDARTPEMVRRKVLEASVRAPMPWHEGAVRAAYVSEATDWRATAVFCMGFLSSFDDTILEALDAAESSVRLEAVRSAGERALPGAKDAVEALLRGDCDDVEMLLAAIEAIPHIDPFLATELLGRHVAAADENIANAALDAVEEAQMFQQLGSSEFDSVEDILEGPWESYPDNEPFDDDDV